MWPGLSGPHVPVVEFEHRLALEHDAVVDRVARVHPGRVGLERLGEPGDDLMVQSFVIVGGDKFRGQKGAQVDDIESNSNDVREPNPTPEQPDLPGWGPGGRGFESRRSPVNPFVPH
jgi:hypothetical protein